VPGFGSVITLIPEKNLTHFKGVGSSDPKIPWYYIAICFLIAVMQPMVEQQNT